MPAQIPAWKVFANPTRIKIIELLRENSQTTGALCERFEISRFGVMQHLKVLEKVGVVSAERRGRYRWNHLNLERLAELEAQLSDQDGQTTFSVPIQPLKNGQQIIALTLEIAVSPSELFAALTQHIDKWWTDTREAVYPTVTLEAHVGGRFYERFDEDGNGVLFATVDQLKRDEQLGLMGTMGNETAISLIRIRLQSTETRCTQLSLQHRFIGEVETAAYEAFQQSWHELLGVRLKLFSESNGDLLLNS